MRSAPVTPRAAIDATLARLREMPAASQAPLLSEWSMYYFAALVVPTIADSLCDGRVPPVAIDDVSCEVDDSWTVTGFRSREGRAVRAASPDTFAPMVEGHLEPMIEACASLLSRRVLWSNAAVMIDHALGLSRAVPSSHAAMRWAAERLLDGTRDPRLTDPYRPGSPRVRTICCLRYRSRGAGVCAGLCPRERDAVVAGRPPPCEHRSPTQGINP